MAGAIFFNDISILTGSYLTFTGNYAYEMGVFRISAQSSFNISNSYFSQNTAYAHTSVGMVSEVLDSIFTNCWFEQNAVLSTNISNSEGDRAFHILSVEYSLIFS